MEPIASPSLRRVLYGLLAACLVLDGVAGSYDMDCDVVSYLDISQLIQTHRWPWVVNAYWHPGYPALLYLARTVTHATVWTELVAARILNFVIALMLLAAVRFALHSAIRLRESLRGQTGNAFVSTPTLELAAAGLTFFTVVRDLGIRAVKPDTLLAVFIMAGCGFLLRIAAGRSAAKTTLAPYAGAALCFGVGFLVKSVTFPLFLVAVLLMPLFAGSIRRAAGGMAVACLLFAAVAGPYIALLTQQKGRFTAGDSGGLNYAWYVDGADRFEQQKDSPGRYGLARGELKHTSQQVFAHPGIYAYGDTHPGTEPQWFDPSYWNDGLRPRFNLRAQISQIEADLFVLLQYVVMRPQISVLLVTLLLLGGRWQAQVFGRAALGPLLLLIAAQLGMYLLVLTESRYIGVSVLMALVALLAFLRVPSTGWTQPALSLAVSSFVAYVLCTSAIESLQSLKLEQRVEGRMGGAYNRATFTAGRELADAPGIHPGDTVACLGEAACRDDDYWARLGGVSIRTEIYAPDDPLATWQMGDEEAMKAALRSTGAKAVVGNFGAGARPPAEWLRLGSGQYFVLYL